MDSVPCYIVTGCAGFIGSHFCDMLLETAGLRCRVVGIDNLSSAAVEDSMDSARKDRRFTFFEEDIVDRKSMDRLFRALRPLAVFNFAAESHVDRSILGGSEFVNSNVDGTLSLLEACRSLQEDNRPITFMQVGTDEVYGSLAAGSANTQSSLLPSSLYSAAKAGADLIVQAYFRTHQLDVRITRCTNNYGPRQLPEKLIPRMIYTAMEDAPLPVYGDGRQIRDWIHVRDHCRGIWDAFSRGEAGMVYHFSGNNEVENIFIVRMILDLLDKPHALISHVEDRKGHDRRYSLDSSASTERLGWRPKVMFAEGLEETVEWYRQNEGLRRLFLERGTLSNQDHTGRK